VAALGARLFARGAIGRLLKGFGHRVGGVEVLPLFFALEHGIGVQRLLDFLLEIQGRELEQSYGLLQLGCHRQLLAHLQD